MGLKEFPNPWVDFASFIDYLKEKPNFSKHTKKMCVELIVDFDRLN